MLKIKEIDATETYPVRLKVLKTNKNYQYKYQGDFDEKTKHFGVFDTNNLIGIVSVMETNHPKLVNNAIQLRGMAIDEAYQKKGIGKLLVRHIEKKYSNKDLIWCNARDYAVGFYNSLGFSIFGKKFYIKNVCDHFVMYKNLNN
ncbi:MAG TPA: GNAT family N-acetyltransferase [Flavobacteriia bacterium]|jgi:ribosomal protein S18 acetylase RimI-like enzyme|nr:GNAT family N-acetyltransferase [Flavobacteriia bacterium]